MQSLIDFFAYVIAPKTTVEVMMALMVGIMLLVSLCYLVIVTFLARMPREVRFKQQHRTLENEELAERTIEMSARESEGI